MTRQKFDHYPTQTGVIRAAIRAGIFGDMAGTVLEPAAGAGQIANVLRSHYDRVITNDIDDSHAADYREDATNAGSPFWTAHAYDDVIGNPPYNVALPIVARSLEVARRRVAMLMRITWMEPAQERAELFAMHADHMVHFAPLGSPRPQFLFGINPKTDKPYSGDFATVAWLVWDRQFSWKRASIPNPFCFLYNWQDEAAQQSLF